MEECSGEKKAGFNPIDRVIGSKASIVGQDVGVGSLVSVLQVHRARQNTRRDLGLAADPAARRRDSDAGPPNNTARRRSVGMDFQHDLWRKRVKQRDVAHHRVGVGLQLRADMQQAARTLAGWPRLGYERARRWAGGLVRSGFRSPRCAGVTCWCRALLGAKTP